MNKRYAGLIAVVAIVLVVLCSFIIYNEWPLWTGKPIVLATRPVDPYDLIRGQYISINYDITSINNATGFNKDDAVYVFLKPDKDGISRIVGISKTPDTQSQDFHDVDFIKGKVTYAYTNSIRVEYGIEQYFFERDAKLPTANMTVEVRIDSSGRAKIYRLLQNGLPINITYQKTTIQS